MPVTLASWELTLETLRSTSPGQTWDVCGRGRSAVVPQGHEPTGPVELGTAEILPDFQLFLEKVNIRLQHFFSYSKKFLLVIGPPFPRAFSGAFSSTQGALPSFRRLLVSNC